MTNNRTNENFHITTHAMYDSEHGAMETTSNNRPHENLHTQNKKHHVTFYAQKMHHKLKTHCTHTHGTHTHCTQTPHAHNMHTKLTHETLNKFKMDMNMHDIHWNSFKTIEIRLKIIENQ